MLTKRSISRRHVFFCFLLTVLLFSVPHSVLAGKLDDFEKDATKEKHDDENKKDHGKDQGGSPDDSSRESLSDSLSEGIVDVIISGMLEGGSYSLKRIEPMPSEPIKPRRSGEALIPFIRMDISYQNVESDISAWDWRGEGGYGPYAVQFRSTHYTEANPPDELKTFQFHLLYRMSIDSYAELDMGIGSLFITGREEHSGISFTFPVLIHPSEHYGIELRPVWSTIDENNIQDIDLAVLAGWRYASIRAGYRWFHSDRESLDGPFIGVSLRW